MSFNWRLYFELAKELSHRPEESARRTAVSRAYYSAFHAASESLKKNNVRVNPSLQRNTHKRVWNVYADSTFKNCRRIGNRGHRLKLDRVAADYDAGSAFTDLRVQKCIEAAASIITEIPANIPESFSGERTGPFARAVLSIKRILRI